MKVIQFLDSLNVGGTEVLALDVCRNAPRAGLDVSLVTTRGGELRTEFAAAGVEIVDIERRMPVDPRLVAGLRKLITSRSIDVVHAHQAVEGLHAVLAARGTRAKVVLTHHGFVPNSKNRLALKFVMPRAARNIFVSEGLRAWYRERHLDADTRAAVVYNGIDPARLAPARPLLKESLGVDRESVVFGMVANFYAAPRKDQFTVCKAFASIAESSNDAHLVFIGSVEHGAEGKYAECVDFCRERGLTGRVHFLGRRNDVADILHSLDVFVLSSIHEGLGIAAIEAMMTKTPCILSDIAPLREVAGDDGAAKLFAPGDHKGLARLMAELGEDKTARIDLGMHGYESSMRRFSIDTHIAALSCIYSEAVGG